MKKYLVVAKNQLLKEFFIYRYFIISFVGGNILELYAQLVVWMAVFKTTEMVNGYNYDEMISYVVIGWAFRFLTTNYSYEDIIAKDIKLGRLSNIIVKPVDYTKYMLSYSLGRVSVAFIVVVLQSLAWIIIFHQNLLFKINLFTFVIFCLFFLFSYVIKFFFSVFIGIIGFWTTEINGVSSAANIFVNIFAGAYFPLDAVGGIFSKIALGLPFAYTLYYPTQIFLGRINNYEAVKALAIMLIWVFILWVFVKILWKLGLKKYESAGI